MGLKLCLLHFGPASPPKEFPAFSSRLPKNCSLTKKKKNERHTLSCCILVLKLNFNLLFLGARNYKTCTCVAIKNYVDLMSLMVSPTGLQWCLVCANGRAQLELISYCGQCTFVFVFVSVLESNVMCARRVCVYSAMLQASCDCFLKGNSLFPTSVCLFLFVWIIFTPLFLSQAPHTVLLIQQYSD